MTSELDLIAALRSRLAPPSPPLILGAGDDAAVSEPQGATATSVDAIVEGVHFRRPPATPHGVGRKALATALSDLAAMGAEAGEAYVVLGVPPDLDEDGCLALLDGIEEVAAETGTALAGGDVTRSPVLFCAVSVVGHGAGAEALVSRSGARGGDLVAVTGELGGAAAGLALIERGGDAGLDERVAAALRARQLDPSPRLAEGRALAGAGAGAMIDISDGLGADAGHLAAESGVRLEIDLAAVPLAAGVVEVAAAGGGDPLELAAGGGEDYELLVCLPEAAVPRAGEAVAAVAGSLTVIGRCVSGDGVKLSGPGGREYQARGWDQLA
jgi:thiamine-monophosphate kinase